MKVRAVSLLLSVSLGLSGFAPAQALEPKSATPVSQLGSVSVAGASVTWDSASLWAPVGCSRFDFSYKNETGIRLLVLSAEITSQFGDSVARESEIGVDPNVFGTWSVQICESDLVDGLGPYRLRLSIEDYDSSERSAIAEINFKARPADIKGLRAVPSTSSATIAWNKLAQAEAYEIRITSNSNFKKFGAWRETSSYWATFKWTGLKRKTNYKVEVRAITTWGYGPASTVTFKTR